MEEDQQGSKCANMADTELQITKINNDKPLSAPKEEGN